MSEVEREKLSTFLFDNREIEVLDIKFLRGDASGLTAEDMCQVARGVLADFFANPKASQLPADRTPQRDVAGILASR